MRLRILAVLAAAQLCVTLAVPPARAEAPPLVEPPAQAPASPALRDTGVYDDNLPDGLIPPPPPPPANVDEDVRAIIADYEELARRSDPDLESKATGEPPRRWPTVTPEGIAARAQLRRDLLERLARIPVAEQGPGLDAAVLSSLLREDIVAADHDLARIPFSGDWGFHMVPPFAASRLKITSVADAEAWIARLDDTPRFFAEHITNMRRGIDTGFTAHPDPLATTLDQIAEQITDKPLTSVLYQPFLDLPDSIPPQERTRLRAEAVRAVTNAIAAYADLEDFLAYEYAPFARKETGLSSLPGGREAYRALTAVYTTRPDLTPEEIHEIGKAEVARIRAEMQSILAEVAWEGDFASFLDFLRTERQFYARTPEELLARTEAVSDRLRAILPFYFNTLPLTPFTVAPVPADIAPGYTTARYSAGDPDTGQTGTYLVNTYRLDQRPLYELPALSAHEGVPGHHIQIMIAMELRGVPTFRRTYYATAFGEGWGLYAERLAGEAGLYSTPYERFGALSYEMWRACRLVSDTGIHLYNWTREEAEACFLENSALSPLNIRNEVTRYIGWPGQALAYKIGELTIMDLRGQAQARLGEDFDIKAFHDIVLTQGALPLALLEMRVERWIATKEIAAAAPPRP